MPFLFLMMILASIFKPSIILLALMYMTINGWILITWYVRGEFLKEKSDIKTKLTLGIFTKNLVKILLNTPCQINSKT